MNGLSLPNFPAAPDQPILRDGGEAVPVGRLDFKPSWGCQAAPGRFDSCSLPLKAILLPLLPRRHFRVAAPQHPVHNCVCAPRFRASRGIWFPHWKGTLWQRVAWRPGHARTDSVRGERS